MWTEWMEGYWWRGCMEGVLASCCHRKMPQSHWGNTHILPRSTHTWIWIDTQRLWEASATDRRRRSQVLVSHHVGFMAPRNVPAILPPNICVTPLPLWDTDVHFRPRTRVNDQGTSSNMKERADRDTTGTRSSQRCNGLCWKQIT